MTDPRDDDHPRQDVIAPIDSLNEQTLAVDLARAEIDQQIATAHKYPRIIDTVVKKISTMALYNEEAAQNCIYALPRGGKPIVGPSIGFANVVATAWGNCIDGARIVYVDRKEKKVNAEGLFHDLESNRRTIIPEDRRVVDSKGRLYSDDMIIVTGKAAASVARRNAILNAVPRAIWHPIYEQALGIVRGTVGTFAERKDKALKAFAQFGVKPEQIYMVLGLKGEVDLTFEHIPSLHGMYAALRDGSTSVEEMFDPRRMKGGGFEQVADPLRDDVQGQAPRSQDKGAPEENAQEGAGGKPEGQGSGGAAPGAQAPAAGSQEGGKPAKQSPKPPGNKKQQAQKAAAAAAQAGGDQKPADPPPAQEPKPQEAKTPEPAKPAAAAAPPQEPAASTAVPRTCEEYVVHATAFIDGATVAADLENRWKGDRTLRTTCMVVEDDFQNLHMRYQAKLAELRKPA